MLHNTSNEPHFNKKSFITVFTETYPLYNEKGSKPLSASDIEYCAQPLVAISSFLNLPNQKRQSSTLSMTDILKNMIHWDVKDEQNKHLGWSTILLAAPRFASHILGVALALPSSTAKLIVELLPGLGEEYCYLGKKNSTANSFKQGAYKIGHFIFSGLHIIGKVLTPSIKGFFPSLQGEDGIFNFIKSGVFYYSLIALAAVVTLTALPLIALKLSTFAFAAILIGEVGLSLFVGYNLYKGCFTPPAPPLQLEEQPTKETPQAFDKLMGGVSSQQENKKAEEPSCFGSLFSFGNYKEAEVVPTSEERLTPF